MLRLPAANNFIFYNRTDFDGDGIQQTISRRHFQKGRISEGKRVSEYLEEGPFRLARPCSQSLAMFCERSVPGESGLGVVRPGARSEQKLASLWRHCSS
jgi:hypothetical protein